MALLIFSLAYKGNSDSCQHKQSESTSRECTIPECVHTWVWKRQQPQAQPDFPMCTLILSNFEKRVLKGGEKNHPFHESFFSILSLLQTLTRQSLMVYNGARQRTRTLGDSPVQQCPQISKSFSPLLRVDVFPLGPSPLC